MSNSAASVLRRALLYGMNTNPTSKPTANLPYTVPSSSPKMLSKSSSLTVDTVCYDLEDSVTPSQKASARSALTSFLSQNRPKDISEISVRINDVSSGLALADLQEVLKAPSLDALVVPKVNSAADLHFVTDVVRHMLPERHSSSPAAEVEGREQEEERWKGPLKILALIESAKALVDLNAICAASPYLSGLIFAAEDFALDLSLTRTPSLTEFLYARSAICTAARAFNLPSTIDLVCTSYKGSDGLKTLEEECIGGRGLGFNGKQCIHPSQVEVVQRAFAPDEKEVEWAMRVCIADEKAAASGRGAWTLDGKMIDAPVSGKAKAVVSRAERCGFDVNAIRDKWKDQEPE
jgi:citrate lyase subunit beta-like protein